MPWVWVIVPYFTAPPISVGLGTLIGCSLSTSHVANIFAAWSAGIPTLTKAAWARVAVSL
jgi:hypothetical protein